MISSVLIWSIAAGIVIIIAIAVLIVLGIRRRKNNAISFEPKAEEEKAKPSSGNYQAKSGFNFSAGPAQASSPTAQKTGEAEPTPPVDTSKEQQSATEIAGNFGQTGARPSAKAAEKPADKVKQPVSKPKPEVKAEPKLEAKPELKPESEPIAQAAPESASSVPVDEKKVAQEKVAEDTVTESEVAGDKAAESGASSEAPADVADVAKAPAPEAEPAPETPEAEPAPKAETPAPKAPVAPVTPEAPEAEQAPASSEAPSTPAQTETPAVDEPSAPAQSETPATQESSAPAPVPTETPEPADGRIHRLKSRLSRSQSAIGQGVLGILGAGDLDEDAWEEIEDTLLMADLGTPATMQVVDLLREKITVNGVFSEAEARAMLREALIESCHPEMDRSIRAMPYDGKPAVILVVGVNGTGKTTTTGKLSRVLTSMGHSVILGAADTFRAAAADQLEAWGKRVGARTVRGAEGADPASVAFDAVAAGVDEGVDVVLLDTAGRLHTKVGLMDQLGKVKRVVEKKAVVDEVLLVLDATVGQNGLTQARIFADTVNISGVVLTKLDGTAKGGIVFQVQEELGVPVKLVGLGEGADDLAPFEVEGYVDALLG